MNNKSDKSDTKKGLKILLRLYGMPGMKKYTSRGSIKRISSVISHEKFEKAYLKVSYGKDVCSDGCVCEFYNDGWYENPVDLKQAFEIFRKELI